MDRSRQKRWVKLRQAVLLGLALVLPFLTPLLPVTGDLERGIQDAWRYTLAPRSGYDPDIALVLYNDQVARTAGATSPIDRALLARALTQIADAGPRAIGVDLAFVQQTTDQPALIAAIRAIRVPVYIIYADPEGDRAAYWDRTIDSFARQDQDAFWAALDGSMARRASPAIGVDAARIARHWPDTAPTAAPLFAHALAATPAAARAYRGAIRYRMLDPELLAAAQTDIDAATGVFPAYPLDLMADDLFAGDYKPMLAGRIVLVGSDTFGADQIATPITRFGGFDRVAGVTVHAQMLRQALDRDFPAPLGWGWIAALALLAAGAGAVTARIDRRIGLLIAAGTAQLALIAALPLVLEATGTDYLHLPLLGLALGWLTAYLSAAATARARSSEERAFARGALGRYVPESVAREILADPSRLELKGEARALTLMFTDLEGFTRFCHGRDPRQTAAILNAYLDAMSAVVLAHGGTLDKYVGDAIVAFWGAPIARADDTARAVACALAMQEAAAEVAARTAAEFGASLGRTRIGIHRGEVVVGNFGGTNRMQYTAMGDAMNIAARLEGANKYLGTAILVSEAVRAAAPDHAYRTLGRVAVSGVASGLALHEPLPADAAGYARAWNAAIATLQSGGGNAAWQALLAAHPEDAAAAALAARIEGVTRGEVHELQSK
jgi:adenylate cyclase